MWLTLPSACQISSSQALLAAGAIPALMALVTSGSDKCREAAADALAALGDVAARDPANRELLKLKVRRRPLCGYPLGFAVDGHHPRGLTFAAIQMLRLWDPFYDLRFCAVSDKHHSHATGMLSQVLPVLLQLLHTSNHDGTRISAISAVKTLTWPPANTDFRQAAPSITLDPPHL